jgi:hypothetical protein
VLRLGASGAKISFQAETQLAVRKAVKYLLLHLLTIIKILTPGLMSSVLLGSTTLVLFYSFLGPRAQQRIDHQRSPEYKSPWPAVILKNYAEKPTPLSHGLNS